MRDINEIEAARQTLRRAGYYVDNLYNIDDVQFGVGNDISDQDAYNILNDVFNDDYICEEIGNRLNELVIHFSK